MVFMRKKHPYTKRIFNVLLEKGFKGAFINKIYQSDDVVHANIHLPETKDISDLQKILPNLQQESGATAIRFKNNGKYVNLEFGMNKLKDIKFDEEILHLDTLKVEFPSAFGKHIVNFEDGSSCHMLNGGTTRMGKTCFLLYVATCVFLQNKGDIKLYISSAKLKDYYPFQDVPSVKMAKDTEGMQIILREIIKEYEKRNKLLYSPALKKATDAKSIRKLYPEYYKYFKPIFLIIDEYARFAKDDQIQNDVTEIVETAGFVNVHVIIASQRPDASTVLKPRIRANLLARMAFTTADKKNSEIILDKEGAENLGRIPGRGILIDSDSHVIQVPLLDVVDCDELLAPYQVEGDNTSEQDTEGRIDNEVTNKIQSLLTQSDSLSDLQGKYKSSECSKQSVEEDVIEWSDFANTKGKG
jgi:S-DNA-T family DNA segregation ATPase FtsK/SpoIIIE